MGLPWFLIPSFFKTFNEARNYPTAALLGPWIGASDVIQLCPSQASSGSSSSDKSPCSLVTSMQGTTYAALVQPKPFKQHMTYDLRRTFLTCMHYAQTISCSKIYCAPSSTIELLKGSLATCDSPAGHCCLYREMEQYGLPVRGVVLFAPSIALPLVADGI